MIIKKDIVIILDLVNIILRPLWKMCWWRDYRREWKGSLEWKTRDSDNMKVKKTNLDQDSIWIPIIILTSCSRHSIRRLISLRVRVKGLHLIRLSSRPIVRLLFQLLETISWIITIWVGKCRKSSKKNMN